MTIDCIIVSIYSRMFIKIVRFLFLYILFSEQKFCDQIVLSLEDKLSWMYLSRKLYRRQLIFD